MPNSVYQPDVIQAIRLKSIEVPLKNSVSDAKVLTGKQKALSEVYLLVAEIETEQGLTGLGFTYTLRMGGPAQFTLLKEIAPLLIGENPNDISRLWNKLLWAAASLGKSGLVNQAIAAVDVALWDLKARRAQLPLAHLLGAWRDAVPCYNTSGGYLQASIDEIVERAQHSLSRGIGGIKMKVGHPNRHEDLRRVTAIRKALGDDVALMVDVNQQWDRATALRMGIALEEFELRWIEEPLEAYDVEGHAMLSSALMTPIGTGEMLTSEREVVTYIKNKAVDLVMHDAPRIGGITPFLNVSSLAAEAGLMMAPHFVMEIHVHLAAAYPHETWVEHFEWLEPVFNERLAISEGKMWVPSNPGLGLSLHEQVGRWTVAQEMIR